MLEVRAIEGDDKHKWGLFIGEKLIGGSKERHDADFARQLIMNYSYDGCKGGTLNSDEQEAFEKELDRIIADATINENGFYRHLDRQGARNIAM